MLRRQSRFFSVIWCLSDLILNSFLFIVAYHIRFTYFSYKGLEPPRLRLFTMALCSFLGFFVVFSRVFGLYGSKRLLSSKADWPPIVYTISASVILYAAFSYAFKLFDVSRLMLFVYVLVSIGVIGGWHLAVRALLAEARRRGYNQRFILIVGAGTVGQRVARHFNLHPEYGYNVVGFLDDYQKSGSLKPLPYRVLGTVDGISRTMRKRVIDRVMIALPLQQRQKIRRVIDAGEYEGVEANVIPDLFSFVRQNPSIYSIDGIPVIGIRSTPVDSLLYIYGKRVFDFLFSVTALIFLSPLMLAIAFAVRISSRGKIFFSQTRVGSNGKRFFIHKFRTMNSASNEEADTTWTRKNDARRTRLGAFLRRTSLDELPQFWNVIKGDMSVVGPRPERPFFAMHFQRKVPQYMIRHQVKTGITGWAQVNGFRGDTSISKRVEYDLFYIENWSFKFDMKIILLTVLKALSGRNAY
jgi:Undecaprenyl-phosphate glucose phosphotransferase